MNPIDIVFSFDTTGSMYPCIRSVRNEIQNITKKLFREIPDLRIGIIAHGDYCDHRTYVTRHIDLTRNENELLKFVRDTENTWGGDAPECYELVLRQVRTEFNWLSTRTKILVMIGDDVPHSANYTDNKLKIDWKNEVGLFNEAGIQIYGVHALPGIRRHSKYFYEYMTDHTGGYYLQLDQFSEIVNLIYGICYKQESNEKLSEYIVSQNSLSFKMIQNLKNLNDETVDYDEVKTYSYKTTELKPVPSGRFQVFSIDRDQDIKSFVTSNGIEFNIGRGFYQLTKSVKVQSYKELILQHKETKEFFNGDQIRKIAGLHPQTDKHDSITETISIKDFLEIINEYNVFIQSTSVNRKLLKGTLFLYEIPDWEVDDKHKPASITETIEKPKVEIKTGKVETPKEICDIRESYVFRFANDAIEIIDMKTNKLIAKLDNSEKLTIKQIIGKILLN